MAQAFDRGPTERRVIAELKAGHTLGLAIDTFDAQFKVASRELAKVGRADLGAKLQSEWNTFGMVSLTAMATSEDVGDHAPYSEWAAEWYAILTAEIPDAILEATHIKDIWVLNFTLPVVFAPEASSVWCAEQLANYPDDNCRDEYRRHFSGTRFQKSPDPFADEILHHGFAPVVIYWSVEISCMAAGGGPACGLIATAAEYGSERWVTPWISNKIYDRKNADTVTMTSCSCGGDGCSCPCDCGCGDGEPCDCGDERRGVVRLDHP
jgi:hypothetical protein